MKAKGIAVRLAVAGAGLLLPLAAAAQMYRPEDFQDPAAGRALELGLSLSSLEALNRDFSREALALAIAGGKVGADRIADVGVERSGPWVLYARFYVLNFQNNLGEQKLAESRVGLGRTGPALGGRIYVGIRKRF